MPDENYEKLAFYFDEKVPHILHVTTLLGISGVCGLNYVLKNKGTAWTVELKIYHCHTNQLPVTVAIPNEAVTYGPKERKASCKE